MEEKDIYNYRKAVAEDVKEWMNENSDLYDLPEDKDTLEREIYDLIKDDDGVTGNASGSYTCSDWQAQENLCHNVDLALNAIAEFGYDSDSLFNLGAEGIDVLIRCYLLPDAIRDCLSEAMLTEDEKCNV